MCATAPSVGIQRNIKEAAYGPTSTIRRRASAGMSGGTMKAAVIFSVPMSVTQRFAWRWRSVDHTHASQNQSNQPQPENFMAQQDKGPNQTNNKTKPPQVDEIVNQKQRQKAEEQEVAGRHKNDGQKGHKGRR